MKNKYLVILFSVFALTIFPALSQYAEQTKAQKKAKIFLAGDSTVQDVNHKKNLDWGWGQVLSRFFDQEVEIVNLAKGGRSTRSFTEEGRWERLVAQLEKGDYVFIQFGHNDASKKKLDRYTTPEQYREYLKKFVTEAKAKGAQPVLITPVSQRKFKKGMFRDSHGEYPGKMKEVAHELKVPLIDLQQKSAHLISSYGEEESKKLFIHVAPGENDLFPEGKNDDTHFSETGALQMATLVVEGIKELKLKPLTAHLVK